MNERKKEIFVPSGTSYYIREQNGNDDQVISSLSGGNELELLTKFLAGVLVGTKTEPDKAPGLAWIKDMPVRDKYVLLIQSRIFSLGSELKFEFQPNEELPSEEYLEDLSEYVVDSYEDFNAKLHPLVIPPYTTEPGEPVKATLTTGRVIEFDFLTAKGEVTLSKLAVSEQHINQQLLIRNIKTEVDGVLKTVVNFTAFTAREMMEIRSLIRDYDDSFDFVTFVENPATGQSEPIPIFSLQDFFFPRLL